MTTAARGADAAASTKAALATALAVALLLLSGAGPAEAKRTIRLSDSATLTVAKGVRITVVKRSATGALPSGERAAGRGVRLRLRGGRSSLLGILRWKLPAGSAAMRAADLQALYRVRMWRGKRVGWVTLPATVSADRSRLLVKLRRRGGKARAAAGPFTLVAGVNVFQPVQHLQTVVGWLVEDLVKLRSGENPTCGTLPPWAHISGLTLDALAPIRGCGRGEGDVAIADLVNNRPYGVVLRYGLGVEFGHADGGFGLPELYGAIEQGGPDGLYIPPQERAAVGVKPFVGSSAPFTSSPTLVTAVLDLIGAALLFDKGHTLNATAQLRCRTALAQLVATTSVDVDSVVEVGESALDVAEGFVPCIPSLAAEVLKQLRDGNSRRALRWKAINAAADKLNLALVAPALAASLGGRFVDWASGGGLSSFAFEGSPPQPQSAQAPTQTSSTQIVPQSPPPQTTPPTTPPQAGPPSTPPQVAPAQPMPAQPLLTQQPPAPPKPYAGNLRVVVHGSGHVGVAFDVGWQQGRDPVVCHFFRDNVEVFTAQCGTSSSKQFYGVPAGTHSWYATVSDRFGVYSNPTNTVTKYND